MKKFVSLITVIFMICTLSVSALEITDEQKADLSRLGIMVGDENGNLNTESPITRAELAKMLCVAGGLTAEGSTDASAFPDVTPAHWAYAYICAARDAGLVVGDENGFFNPEAHVTNEETVKMIVSLIGYSPMAVSTGGFPAGYNATAARLGLTAGLALAPAQSATRNDAAIMLSKALDIPLMKMNDHAKGSEDADEFVVLDGTVSGFPLETLRIKLDGKN